MLQYNHQMRKTRTLAVVLGVCALASVITCSPFGGGDFACSGNASCSGMSGGVCEANGFCSFADPSCGPMGQRYSDGPGAGTCVMTTPVPIDAPVSSIDASVDAPVLIDAGTGGMEMVQRFCLGTFVHLCVPTPPTDIVVLPPTLSTDAAPCRTDVTDMNGTPDLKYCVITGALISGSTIATGTRPLVLISAGDITITQLDAASHRGGTVGPAANSTLCLPPGAAGPGGGGGGGGFGGKGGDGGAGVGAGGAGGKPSPATVLRGGCPGGAGSTANTLGNGGGSVMLVAVGTITISTSINASGSSSASAGGSAGAGASGGGSGGMIVLEAATLANNGNVFANGGSGAEGSGAGGNPGGDGNDPTNATAAPGGGGSSATGGDGGAGGAKPPTNGDGVKGSDGTGGGGGGGGGAIGVILTHGSMLGGATSPTPTTF